MKIKKEQTRIVPKTDTDLKAVAENKIQTTQKNLDAVWNKILDLEETSDVRLEAETNLNAAQEAIMSGEVLFETGAYAESLEELHIASGLISDTSALIDATTDSGGDVKDILDITPTPVVSPSVTPTPTRTPTPTPSPSPTPEISPTLHETL